MRIKRLALMAMLLLATVAHAQEPDAYVIPSVPAPRDPLPRFTIAPRGGALGPIGLPLPPIGLQPPAHPEPGKHRRGRVFVPWPMVFYVPHPLASSAPQPQQESRPVAESPAPGRLILAVEPASAQVFVDGYYVGAPEDFSAAHGGGVLEAGIHRIDISAPGHESMTMDVRTNPGRPVTIRAALKVLASRTPVPPTTFYLIPGCYLGNIPPQDARLPATCDQSRAVTWQP